MFFTYLRRELRRRMRQGVFIALGLALGVGLVITVTAAVGRRQERPGHRAARAVRRGHGRHRDQDADRRVLHAGLVRLRVPYRHHQAARGRHQDRHQHARRRAPRSPRSARPRSPPSPSLHDVAAAAGGLTLNDRTLSGTVPAINTSGGGGGFGGRIRFRLRFRRSGPELPRQLHHQHLRRRRRGPQHRRTRPAQLRQAQRRAHLHHRGRHLPTSRSWTPPTRRRTSCRSAPRSPSATASGTTTNFKVVGIVSEPAGDNPSDVYIPLAVAQKLANMKNDVNTIYVAASSASDINAVSSEIKPARCPRTP